MKCDAQRRTVRAKRVTRMLVGWVPAGWVSGGLFPGGLVLVGLALMGVGAIPAATATPQEGRSAGASSQSGSSSWLFEIDPAESAIGFELGATMHTVEGTAEITAGTVRFDPGTGTASGRIEVDARSLDTGHDGRDEDMHTKVLESARYPEIYFEAESLSGDFAPTGTSRVAIEGTFGIHGEAHPMRLTFDVDAAGDSLEASTEFRVPYVEWGMEDPSKFLLRVDKHVTVRIEAVGSLSRPEPQAPAADEFDAETDTDGVR